MSEYLAPNTLTDLDLVATVGELSMADAGHSHSHSCTIFAVADSDSDSTPVLQAF